MKRDSTKWLLLIAALVLLVSACGDSDESSDASDESSTTAAVTETTAAATETTAAATETTASGGTETTAQAGGSDEAIELRITWWGGESRHEATLAAIELFEAANPNITVVAEFQGWDGYWDKIATLTAGGNAPDVYQHNFGFFGEYVERNALLALDTRAELDLTGWDDAITNQGTSGGSRYALPTGGNIHTLLFDVETVTGAGVSPEDLSGDLSWDEFATIATQVSDAGGDGYYAVNDSGGISNIFEVWLKQSGKQIYNADGTLGFTAEDAAEYWEYWSALRDAGSVPPIDLTTQVGDDLATHPLSLGQAAMQFGFSAQFNAYTDASGVQLALAPLPNGGSSAQPGMFNVATGLMWAASADSEHPAEAATLINFLVNDPGAIQAQGLQRGVPLSQAGRDLLEVEANDQAVIAYISEQATSGNVALESVLYTSPPLNSGEVSTLFGEKYQEVAFGAASSLEAAQSFIEEALEILADI
jgi:multiple sugar transport system substrate-binding protein